MALGIFKIAFRLKDGHVFMRQLVEVLNDFSILTLKQISWKTRTFFKKLGYRFLVESTKIEKASFPYKTAISNPDVKTNRIDSTKWTYHKEWSLAISCLIILRFCFSLRTSYKELIWCCNDPNAHTATFCKHWRFIWRCYFLVSILKCSQKRLEGTFVWFHWLTEKKTG